jgi:hypothetical protein
MIQVRDTYQLRFGRIDQAVDLFRRLPEMAGANAMPMRHNAMTDVSGSMYTFVSELIFDSLGQWESQRSEIFQGPGFDEWFREFQLIVQTGRQEFYSLEGEHTGWSRPGVIIVREVYRALKWQIRPAVALLQRYGALLTDAGVGRNPRILTDLSGDMFQAVIEIETEGLSDWESMRRELYKRADFQVWFAQLSSCVEMGGHEFYRLEI